MTFAERNTELCKLYIEGQTIAALSERYKLSGQRVRQIVVAAGIWKPQEIRPAYVGVDLRQETKDCLKKVADKQKTSLSKLISDQLDVIGRRFKMSKTDADLLTDEFFEHLLTEIPRMLPPLVETIPGDAAASFSHRAAYRRLMRELILKQLEGK